MPFALEVWRDSAPETAGQRGEFCDAATTISPPWIAAVVGAALGFPVAVKAVGRCSLKGVRLLRGFRGSAPVAEDAFRDAILRISALVGICPEIQDTNGRMTSGGAILDMDADMTSFSCTVDERSRGDRPNSSAAPKGIFLTAAEKFPRHILVVDDEPLIRWSVAESLSDLGYDVEQAGDATSALRTVTTTALAFDVVVLDLRLPDMADLSLLSTLRQLLPRATLVLMTAFGTPEVVAEAMALGADVIHKPFELDVLQRLVTGSGTATR